MSARGIFRFGLPLCSILIHGTILLKALKVRLQRSSVPLRHRTREVIRSVPEAPAWRRGLDGDPSRASKLGGEPGSAEEQAAGGRGQRAEGKEEVAAGTLELRFTLNSLIMSVSRCPRPGGSCPQDLQEQSSSAGTGLSPAVRGPDLGIPGLGWNPGGDGQWGAGGHLTRRAKLL